MVHLTKVLLDRALNEERSGQWQSAVALCQQAFWQGVVDHDGPMLAEAVLRCGNAYRQMGELEKAREQFELAFTIAELNGYINIAARALNGQAVLYQTQGSLDQAHTHYTQARSYALRAGDVVTAGSIDQNLGTIANIRGDLALALKHYQSGLECYEQALYERGICLVLNNMGMLHVDLKEISKATACLDRALNIAQSIGDVASEAIIHVNRAELQIAVGNLESARISCDLAFEFAGRLGDDRIRAEALKYSGIVYRETEKPHLAELHLREAAATAARNTDPLVEAEAQRELSLVLRAQDRNRESLEALNRSHSLFQSLKASRDQADVDNRIGQLEQDFLALVRVWGESIEAKDRYTRGHCQRVAEYACEIAERVGIPQRDMIWFRMGAFLHDVGKTDIPEEILNKPGRLTDCERLVMERHTIIGADMLAPIPFPWDISPMVRSHHERWDGKGYPDQLCGEQIPLTARILRLADVFDALTTSRSYRQPLSPDEAFHIMQSDDGAFDPWLFEIFQELFPKLSRLVGGTDSLH